jgi:hypothetical protein
LGFPVKETAGHGGELKNLKVYYTKPAGAVSIG